MSLTVTENLIIQDVVTEDVGLGGATQPVQELGDVNITYGNGTGFGNIQENVVLTGVTVSASGTQTYTLSAMTDSLGRTIAFSKVRKVLIIPTTITDGDTYSIAPGASHGWTALFSGTSPKLSGLSGPVLIATQSTAGFAVTANSNDQVTITNNGSHSMTFTFAFSGE